MIPLLQTAVRRHNQGDAATAEALFRVALAEAPDDPEAWQLLAAHLMLREHFAAAETCARRAVFLAPSSAVNWATLGAVEHRLQRYDDAMATHSRALAIDPKFAPALRNRGLTLCALGRPGEGVADFTAAANIVAYDDPGMLGDAAWVTLASGNLKRGLELAERREVKPSMVWDLGITLWRGEDLTGKSILVHHEQGFGDTIMWARYIPVPPITNIGITRQDAALVRAEHVTVAVHQGLLRLFRAQGWDTIVLPGEMPPRVDFHVPFDSLAYLLGIEAPDGDPYLYPPAYKALIPVTSGTRLKVGIVWSSGLQFVYGRNRSMPVESILPLVTIPGVRLYSLAPEGTADIARIGAGALITDMGPMIRDWADTAAIIDKLDVVVSVDTATLHLAGAMGKDAIGLMPFNTAWQWHPKGQERASWYESVRLLWQERPGDWAAQIEEVARLLA